MRVACLNYKVFLNGELLFFSWKEQGLVYHIASGNTHLLENFAFQILLLLNKQPKVDSDFLMKSLKNELLYEKDDSKDYLLSVLMALQKIDLLKLKE